METAIDIYCAVHPSVRLDIADCGTLTDGKIRIGIRVAPCPDCIREAVEAVDGAG